MKKRSGFFAAKQSGGLLGYGLLVWRGGGKGIQATIIDGFEEIWYGSLY